jgi:hypothetical protein
MRKDNHRMRPSDTGIQQLFVVTDGSEFHELKK